MSSLRKHWKRIILPVISLGAFSAITLIVVFAKANVHSNYDNRILTTEFSRLYLQPELNANELKVLTGLGADAPELLLAPAAADNVFARLYQQLKAYLGSKGVELTKEEAEEATESIEELNHIIMLEGRRDLKQMSLDTKGIASHLSQLIYQSCGLKLSFDLLGNIDTISTTDGGILYHRHSSDQDGLHFEALAITLSIISLLLFGCTQIARKHQLFHKEELYDSFDEEKYA